jgi:hypothetical protein
VSVLLAGSVASAAGILMAAAGEHKELFGTVGG